MKVESVLELLYYEDGSDQMNTRFDKMMIIINLSWTQQWADENDAYPFHG